MSSTSIGTDLGMTPCCVSMRLVTLTTKRVVFVSAAMVATRGVEINPSPTLASDWHRASPIELGIVVPAYLLVVEIDEGFMCQTQTPSNVFMHLSQLLIYTT